MLILRREADHNYVLAGQITIESLKAANYPRHEYADHIRQDLHR